MGEMQDRIRRPFRRTWVATVALWPTVAAAADANWPAWRGDGSGISHDTHPPLHWGTQQNVLWKIALPGEGNSSPILWNGKIFLTASTDSGKKRLLLSIDPAAGKILWQSPIDAATSNITEPKNGYAP